MDEHIRTAADFAVAAHRDSGEPASVAVAPWHGIEQSLASVALGGVFAVMAFPTFLMVHVLMDTHFRGWPRALVAVAAIMGTVGVLFVLTSAVFGLVFGILGGAAAKRNGRSVALGFSGVLLNILDLFIWVGMLLAWIGTVAGAV